MKHILFKISLLILPFFAFAQKAETEILGYQLKKGKLVFEFDASRYTFATRSDDGTAKKVNELEITDVKVFGDFNNWSRETYS